MTRWNMLSMMLLAGCVWITEAEYVARQDRDDDGYVAAQFGGLDCDDGDDTIGPDAEEIWYDGVDQDCDGLSDYDQDGDGFDAEAYGGLDCDDEDRTVHPDAEEDWYDDFDQNCDEANDYDQDGDGYVHQDHGDQAGGTAPNIGDCDDEDEDVNPGAEEILDDGVDNNCDGCLILVC